MGLILHPDAKHELDEATREYEREYPGRGRRFRLAVRALYPRIRSGPHTFQRWEGTDTRFVVVQGWPYTLLFGQEGNNLVIYAVAHHSRAPGYWRARV
jgi:toxin ParE1/3/4